MLASQLPRGVTGAESSEEKVCTVPLLRVFSDVSIADVWPEGRPLRVALRVIYFYCSYLGKWCQSLINVGSPLAFSNSSPIKSKHPKVWNTDIPARGSSEWRQVPVGQSEGGRWLQNEQQNRPRDALPDPQIQQGPPNSCLPHLSLLWHLWVRCLDLERKRNR